MQFQWKFWKLSGHCLKGHSADTYADCKPASWLQSHLGRQSGAVAVAVLHGWLWAAACNSEAVLLSLGPLPCKDLSLSVLQPGQGLRFTDFIAWESPRL